MAQVKSEFIKVYPSAYRSQISDDITKAYDPESRLPTESNIINQTNAITNGIVGKSSYIISPAPNTSFYGLDFEFVINGYKFKLNGDALRNTLSGLTLQYPLYAKIKLVDKNNDETSIKANTDYKATSLAPVIANQTTLDGVSGSDNLFYGIDFTNTTPTLTTNEYSLQLIDENGKTPKTSYLNDSVNINNITSENITADNINVNTKATIKEEEVEVSNTTLLNVNEVVAKDSIKFGDRSNPTTKIDINGITTSYVTSNDIETNRINDNISLSDTEVYIQTPLTLKVYKTIQGDISGNSASTDSVKATTRTTGVTFVNIENSLLICRAKKVDSSKNVIFDINFTMYVPDTAEDITKMQTPILYQLLNNNGTMSSMYLIGYANLVEEKVGNRTTYRVFYNLRRDSVSSTSYSGYADVKQIKLA